MNNYDVSKYIVMLLRHHPEYLNLNMSIDGWVSVDEIIEKVNKEKRLSLTIDDIKKMVAVNNKQRFALKEEDEKFYIRANQGHSIKKLKMGYEPLTPPDILYHGTGEKYLKSILAKGLIPKGRQYVHLSPSREIAYSVGIRHGEPVIFAVDAKKMSSEGIVFYCSENGVWLTDFVDVKYLRILD